jgi:hypothetical protein
MSWGFFYFRSSVRCGVVWFVKFKKGQVWCGVVWFFWIGVRCGVVWFGKFRNTPGVVWCGLAKYFEKSVVWCGVASQTPNYASCIDEPEHEILSVSFTSGLMFNYVLNFISK